MSQDIELNDNYVCVCDPTERVLFRCDAATIFHSSIRRSIVKCLPND